MKPQHLILLAIAILACALLGARADAAELALASNTIILADSEVADSATLSTQDFTGGVGLAVSNAGGALVIQMAQPSGSSSDNAPSNYAYVRTPAGH
jgi:hypothetical protein